MILSACKPAAEPPAVEEPVVEKPAAEVEAPPAPEPEETVKIDFWHSMGGDLGGVAIPQMADDFNAHSQNALSSRFTRALMTTH